MNNSAIHKKGFAMSFHDPITTEDQTGRAPIDYSKIKIGVKQIEDAIIKLGTLSKTHPEYTNKDVVLNAIRDGDINKMREISRFFYKVSGIYPRLCRHMAFLYRYDWVLTPHIKDKTKAKKEQINKIVSEGLYMLDNFGVKSFCGDCALDVFRDGSKYIYLVQNQDKIVTQELPSDYCRSRFSVNGRPVIEFNMKFFDDYYRHVEYRMRMLKAFPLELQKGYVLYKEGKLPPDYPGDKSGWYALEPENTFKFNIYGEDYPPFMAVIPALIDLDAAQELDRKKMAQQLIKIIVQKMPLDKNGDLVFDIDEAAQLHNNAVRMLGKAIGVDVLTTFAEVDAIDLADKSSVTSVDELEKVERTVYNESGTAQNLFNTDGNIALEKSILNDEAAMYNLLLQFELFFGYVLKKYKNNKKVELRIDFLTTTIYNYKELAKLYKEQVQLGYSKRLPQIALGQSQSFILDSAYFENEVLGLNDLFLPPQSSNTMSSKGNQKTQTSDSKGGRPEKEDDQKSEKTIQNRESMN